jgi:hypothetical protein
MIVFHARAEISVVVGQIENFVDLINAHRAPQQADEKDSPAALRSIASLQRTADVRLRSSIFRAPASEIFLINL